LEEAKLNSAPIPSAITVAIQEPLTRAWAKDADRFGSQTHPVAYNRDIAQSTKLVGAFVYRATVKRMIPVYVEMPEFVRRLKDTNDSSIHATYFTRHRQVSRLTERTNANIYCAAVPLPIAVTIQKPLSGFWPKNANLCDRLKGDLKSRRASFTRGHRNDTIGTTGKLGQN
jgi:hypothetical protein